MAASGKSPAGGGLGSPLQPAKLKGMPGVKQPGPAIPAPAPTNPVASPEYPGAGGFSQDRFWLSTSASFPVLSAVWLAAALLRFGAAMLMTSPSVLTDELTYWSMARSFHHGMHFLAFNVRADYPSQLYSVLLSPLFSVGDVNVVYALAKLVSSLMFCSVIFPAYFLAREILDQREALGVALLSLLIPGGIYTATVMTENLYYPAFVLSAWLAYRALYRGKLRDGILAGLGFVLAYYVKPHVLFLMAGYGLAVAIWFCSRLTRSYPAKPLVKDEFAGLLRRGVPFVVFAFGLLIRYFETRSFTDSLAALVFGESYLGILGLDKHRIPLSSFLISGTWLLTVMWISTALLPVLAVFASAFQWKRLGEQQRWFWVLTACTAGLFLFMITRHNVLNDGILRTHERYVFQLSPLFFTWYFASRKQLPLRWLLPVASIILIATSVAITHSSNVLSWNNSSDSPTLSGLFWMHIRYPGRPVILVVLLIGGGLLCLSAPLLSRKPLAIVTIWAIFLIGCNAGWYGLRLKLVQPEVRRFNDLAAYVGAVVPRNDAIGVLEDNIDARVGWYGNFWLSQPFYFYFWQQHADWFAVAVTRTSDGSLNFGQNRPQFLLASDSIALPYVVVHDFPAVKVRMYLVPPGTK